MLQHKQQTLGYNKNSGDDLVSTWVAKPEVHAENVDKLVKLSANYSCKR